MEEREVNLRDLIFEILLHWRGILLWMLIGGALLGISSWATSYKARTKRMENATAQQLESQMTQSELSAVQQALLNEYSCEKWQAYMENSALMNLDASAVYQADLVYTIKAPGIPTNPVAVYLNLLASNNMRQFVADQTQALTVSDIQELIHVSDPGGAAQTMENCSFSITALGETKKACVKISKAVQKYMNDLHKQLTDTFGSHEMLLLQNNITSASSASLLQEQIDMRGKIAHLNSETASLMEHFSEPQTRYYQLQTKKEGASQSLPQKSAAEPGAFHAFIRAFAWGLLFGAIIYVFIIFFLYITNNKLRYSDGCALLCHVPVLGRIPAKPKAKKPFDAIDHWLRCQWDKGRYGISPNQALRLSAVAVQAAARQKGLACLYGISCSPLSDALVKIDSALCSCLKDAQIDFQTAHNILYDADSLQLLCGIRAAVLIEKAGCVQYEELQRELELLQRQKIELLGLIFAE